MYMLRFFNLLSFIIGFIMSNNPNNIFVHEILTLTAAAYCPVNEIENWNCKMCSQNVSGINIIDDDTRIIMGYDNSLKAPFISIRGSSDINNWISNLETRIIHPYQDKNIGVHNGLYYEYLRYKDTLISYLLELNDNSNIIITGHSSGGAIASLLTYDLVTDGYIDYRNILLYSFGSPRIGNNEFVKSFLSFDIKHNRITYKNDIVPHLPEEFLGFHHIPHEIWYTSSDKFTICNDMNGVEDNHCSNSCSPFSCTSISDHLNYLDVSIGTDAC